ncbi:MAG: hypothetical protein VB065_11615, partial [Eubacteriales bacterium]|nr:hypothetical protein [Eubacteriales bacterium]
MRRWQGPLMYALLVAMVLMVVQMSGTRPRDVVTPYNYTGVLKLIEEDRLTNVLITGNQLVGRLVDSAIPVEQFGRRYDIKANIPSAERFYADVNVIYAKKLSKPASEVVSTDYGFDILVEPPAGAPWWQEFLPLL